MNDPRPLVVANLKANKTWGEMSLWLDKVAKISATFTGTIIVCPSTPFLAAANEWLKAQGERSTSWRIKLGSQDVSQFEQGAYTGETAASQIADLCQYAIIGHSERRTNFHETDQILTQKVIMAKKAMIEPIFCVQKDDDSIPQGVSIVAYEPTFAIGTGEADSPQNVQKVATLIKKRGPYTVLYGGSVSPQNIKSYLLPNLVSGVLVGATNTQEVQNFIAIIQAAT